MKHRTVNGRMFAVLCVLLGVGLALQTTAAASLSVPERDRVSLQAQIMKSPLYSWYGKCR
jgi:hypothetical protein